MSRIVMKFGGTSVADLDRIRNVARFVRREVEAGSSIVVVVSAMAGETNKLVALCRQAGPADPKLGMHDVEYDAVVSSGEQVTSGLLALVLQNQGLRARSWQGNVRLSSVRCSRRLRRTFPYSSSLSSV